MPRKRVTITIILALTWTSGLAIGLHTLFSYENKAGAVGRVPAIWPADSKIACATDRPTLLMLAHPRCPCTSASLDELEQIVTRVQGKVKVYVVFWLPEDSPDWRNTSLQRKASALPGVTVLRDLQGKEANLFGAETSGQTLLYSAKGQLLFAGGITGSRGHAGYNVGESAIERLVENENSGRSKTLVFGCSLETPKGKGSQAWCRK